MLEAPSYTGDNYGSRMKGWLMPPVTGDYVFWIASDDAGELWLSSDDHPENKILFSFQLWATWSPRCWTQYPEQKSKKITLVAGRAYYYEVCAFGIFILSILCISHVKCLVVCLHLFRPL
jgi:endoglucanase